MPFQKCSQNSFSDPQFYDAHQFLLKIKITVPYCRIPAKKKPVCGCWVDPWHQHCCTYSFTALCGSIITLKKRISGPSAVVARPLKDHTKAKYRLSWQHNQRLNGSLPQIRELLESNAGMQNNSKVRYQCLARSHAHRQHIGMYRRKVWKHVSAHWHMFIYS